MTTNRDQSIDRLLRGKGPTEAREHALPAEADCPDTEALAAFTDDVLTAAERQTVEAHVADCDRCQALTAAMVRMTIPPGAAASRAAAPWWKSRATLNWLVPATAAATALALWVAVPGQRSPATEESQAKIQTAATPQPAPADVGLRSKSDGRADNEARADATETGAALGSTASKDAPPAAPAQSSLARDQNLPSRKEGVAEEATVTTSAEPERSRQLDQTAGFAARAAAPAAPGFEVVSPDPLVRWRVAPGNIVQYSADGGSTWVTQQTGAPATLTAGSSPSPLVCWLVGRAGAVLRSTDGGRQWQRVVFPEAEDLVAVSASSALAATVDLAGGRRLSTTDGGRTWTAVTK